MTLFSFQNWVFGILDWDCANVDLDDSGADTVKELEAEGVSRFDPVHSVHTGINICLHMIMNISIIVIANCIFRT